MAEILFAFPGLIGLGCFVFRRTPWPGREWILTTFGLLISAWSLGWSYFLRYSVVLNHWDSLEQIASLFQVLDSSIAHIANENPPFLQAGIYSFSFVIATFTGTALNFLPEDWFQNAEGKDYADFLREDLIFTELVNNKIYVGKVTEAPINDQNPDGLITLVPLMSGFRSAYDEVIYTNLYSADAFEEENLKNLEISFPIRSVATMRHFSVEAFEKFEKLGTTVIRFKAAT